MGSGHMSGKITKVDTTIPFVLAHTCKHYKLELTDTIGFVVNLLPNNVLCFNHSTERITEDNAHTLFQFLQSDPL